MTKNDGGPAFPSGKIDAGMCWEDFPYLGLSLRDWFAGQAVVAATSVFFGGNHDNGPCAESIARNAYLVADAMLKAREE